MVNLFRLICLILSFVMPVTALKVRLQLIGSAQTSATDDKGGGSQGPSVS